MARLMPSNEHDPRGGGAGYALIAVLVLLALVIAVVFG